MLIRNGSGRKNQQAIKPWYKLLIVHLVDCV